MWRRGEVKGKCNCVTVPIKGREEGMKGGENNGRIIIELQKLYLNLTGPFVHKLLFYSNGRSNAMIVQ